MKEKNRKYIFITCAIIVVLLFTAKYLPLQDIIFPTTEIPQSSTVDTLDDDTTGFIPVKSDIWEIVYPKNTGYEFVNNYYNPRNPQSTDPSDIVGFGLVKGEQYINVGGPQADCNKENFTEIEHEACIGIVRVSHSTDPETMKIIRWMKQNN